MSSLEWIILAVIILVGILACVAVERIKKQGHQIPGSMCAGCPATTTVDKKPIDRKKLLEHEHPNIML